MVELEQINSPIKPSRAFVASAIDEALASGVSPSEILHMVAAGFSPSLNSRNRPIPRLTHRTSLSSPTYRKGDLPSIDL